MIEILHRLNEFCNESQHLEGSSDQTIKRYQQNIRYFCSYTGLRYVDEINKKKVFSFFLYGRAQRNWTPATYRTYYMSLKVFLGWLKSEGDIQETYIQDLKLPRLGNQLPKALREPEALQLLVDTHNHPWFSEFERTRNHAIIATYLFTGVRRNELLHLTEYDLKFENKMLQVRNGKGNKSRVIPMCDRLIHILEVYLVEKQKRNYTCPSLFCSSKRDVGLKKEGLKKMMNKLKVATGLTFGNHILRHTFAVLMLIGGCDIVSLSKMMGHSSIKTTMKYLLLYDEQLSAQMVKHPFNIANHQGYDGTINNLHSQRYSEHVLQRSQKHQILRENQFSQPEQSLWNSYPSRYSIPHHYSR